MSPYKPNATYATSEWKYTVAVGEVQVPRGGSVFTNDERWSEEIDTRIGKTNAVRRELDRSVVTKRELANTTNCQFLNRSLFRLLHKVINLGQCPKEFLPRCKRQRWDFCEDLTV